MNSGQPRPLSIIDQKIGGKIQFVIFNQMYIFPTKCIKQLRHSRL